MVTNYKTRSTIIFLFFCLLYAMIIFNLYLLQITQSTFFSSLGYKQYNVTVTTYPPRAAIYDRHGQPLALNHESIAAFIMPNQLETAEKTKAFLAKHFSHAVNRLVRNKDKKFMYIERRLTEEQQSLLAEIDISDIKLLHESSRFYPINCATPVVGITDIDNNGLCGIELTKNNQLCGTPTTYQLQKDARSGYFYFAKETTISGHTGISIQLTLDSTLQFLAQEELNNCVNHFNAQEGAILILDPQTGEILSMNQYPLFDPHHRKNLMVEQTHNRIVSQAYELGSVMKVCGALAALEEEVVTLDDLIDCKNAKTAYVDGRRINTVIPNGIIPFYDVIAYSNNIGMAQIAKRLDYKLYEHYCRLGFGKKISIDIPGEQEGFINPPHNWSKQSIFSLSYGYEIRATLLQLAHAFAIIANDGFDVKPHLIFTQKNNISNERLYSQKSINAIKTILKHNTQEGTARRARIKGYSIMTKTGSADLLVNGEYRRDKSIFTCAGIIECDNYKRVIITFIKEPQRYGIYAATVTAPLFEQIAQKMLIHDKKIRRG